MARSVTIAATSLVLLTAPPEDLNARLISTTGCGVQEIEQLLVSSADRCAHALTPFLANPVDHVDLSNLIANDPAAIGAIRALYVALPEPAEPAQATEAE